MGFGMKVPLGPVEAWRPWTRLAKTASVAHLPRSPKLPAGLPPPHEWPEQAWASVHPQPLRAALSSHYCVPGEKRGKGVSAQGL